MPNTESPNPMNAYSGSLLINLAIQQIAENHTPEALWNSLENPALPSKDAAALAPSLEQATADAVSAHKMPPSLENSIMAQLEALAHDIAARIPADEQAALAQAVRRRTTA